MTSTPSLPVAELERRFYAFTLDRLLVWGLYGGAIAMGVTLWPDNAWPVVTLVVGTVLLVSLALSVLLGLRGVSPGKALVGLRVVDDGTGAPMGVGPAILRTLIVGLSTLPTFGIGLATLAWTAVEDRTGQRRGWHDLRAGSVVIDIRPVPEVIEEQEEAPRHVVNLTAMRLVPAPPAPPPAAPPRATRPSPSPQAEQSPQPRSPQPQSTQSPSIRSHTPQAPPAADPDRTVVRSARGTSAPGPVPSGPRWRLTFDTGETFVVEGPVLVGRNPESRQGEPVQHRVGLPSQDMSLSKTHAQLTVAPDGNLMVLDRGSTNGSSVVRQGSARDLTPGQPTTLVHGDQLRFGDRTVVVAREA